MNAELAAELERMADSFDSVTDIDPSGHDAETLRRAASALREVAPTDERFAKDVDTMAHALGMLSMRDCECTDDEPLTCAACVASQALVKVEPGICAKAFGLMQRPPCGCHGAHHNMEDFA